LLFQALDSGRQKSVQAKVASLLLRERRAFVQPLVKDEIHPARQIRQTRPLHLVFCSHCRIFLSPFAFDAIVLRITGRD
jgi:hypothetical protein